jgi:hypothetical protein
VRSASRNLDIVFSIIASDVSAVDRGAKAEPKPSNRAARTDFLIALQELLAKTGG